MVGIGQFIEEKVSRNALAAAAVLACAAVAVAGVLLRPLIPIDETRYIDVAWEMRQQGSWFLPLKNYELYTDKPPMLFWLVNLIRTLTGGVTGFAARLGGPAFAVLALAGTWALGRRLWDDATGALAAVVLAGLSVFEIHGGATMFDTMLACATLGGLWAMVGTLSTNGLKRNAWLGLGLALGFGVLAKGPVILLHLAPVLVAFPVWTDPARRPTPREVAIGVGIALALAIVALWIVPAAILGGVEYRHMVLWVQTAGRAVQSFAHARPWYWLMATLPVVLSRWVWTVDLWRGLMRLGLGDRALRLVLVQAQAGPALFSLVSGKQVHYLLPEMPELPAAAVTVLIGIAALHVSFGLLGDARNTAMMQPLLPVLGFAAFCLALASAALFLPRPVGMATLGLGLGCVALIGTTGTGPAYDRGVLARLMAPYEDAGIAVVTHAYSDELDFAGRLTRPIDLQSPDQAAAWLAAHPGGMLAGHCRAVPLDPGTAQKVRFYGADRCLWVGAPG